MPFLFTCLRVHSSLQNNASLDHQHHSSLQPHFPYSLYQVDEESGAAVGLGPRHLRANGGSRFVPVFGVSAVQERPTARNTRQFQPKKLPGGPGGTATTEGMTSVSAILLLLFPVLLFFISFRFYYFFPLCVPPKTKVTCIITTISTSYSLLLWMASHPSQPMLMETSPTLSRAGRQILKSTGSQPAVHLREALHEVRMHVYEPCRERACICGDLLALQMCATMGALRCLLN
jgi:hypothetical protein